MKVLVCHNRYRSEFPSGENRYVEDEVALLCDAGIDIARMTEESDSLINGGPLQMANAALGLMCLSILDVHYFAAIIIQGQSGTYLHLPGRVTDLLANSGLKT
jgi:hypothetical protein